jgi:hypothetical protein
VREKHGVEGFLGECVTAWYDSLSLLKLGGNALVWPYMNASQVSKLMKNKLPLLTLTFGWRSKHGKLYGNKDFFRFGVKQSGKCGFCDNPRQSVENLYTECTYSQHLFACFEHKFKLNEKLS